MYSQKFILQAEGQMRCDSLRLFSCFLQQITALIMSPVKKKFKYETTASMRRNDFL